MTRSVSSQVLPDGGFPFSNDSWDEDSAMALRRLLHTQQRERKSAAIFVGAGSLPYTLGFFAASQFVLLDKSPSMPSIVHERINLLPNLTCWDDYLDKLNNITDPSQQKAMLREFKIIHYAGAVSSFDSAKRVAQNATFVECVSDIIDLPNHINSLGLHESPISFINFTNVADYIGKHGVWDKETGSKLAHLLYGLPLTDDAVVVDSSHNLGVPHPVLASEYINAQGAISLSR